MQFLPHSTVLLVSVIWFWNVAAAPSSHGETKCPTRSASLPAQYFTESNSERIKVHYGPFTVPPRSEDGGMRDFDSAVPAPCSNCLVTWMQAGLEYPDGAVADADTNMWLHHVVFANLNRADTMCQQRKERFFASGNERTAIDLCSSGTKKIGYHIDSEDRMAFTFEAMNMGDTEQEVVLTVIWEYVPSTPKAFRKAIPHWFDIGGCDSSEFPALRDSVFEYSSPTTTARTSGHIALIAGHLHDGGTDLHILKNREVLCTAKASYDKRGHISKISTCENSGSYAPGDEFYIQAQYDTVKRTPMEDAKGELEPVMGIALVYEVEHHHKHRHLKRTILIAALAIGLIAGLAYAWFRVSRRSVEKVMPKWVPGWMLRRPNDYVIIDHGDQQDHRSDGLPNQPLLREEYRDEE